MIQLGVIGAYLALLLGLGMFAGRMFRGTSKDYMLASHSIGPFLLLMSIFGTTMTAFALVGSTGEAYKVGIGVYGMLASSSGIIHSLCFFVIGVKLWSFGHKYGYTTQIQFFRDRLESDRIGIVLFPVLVGLVIPYLLIGVMASGTVINSVTEGTFTTMFAQYDYGVPNWIGSLVICFVVLIYVFLGGMRGTAWANAFQTIVFMVLGIVTFYLIADKFGGVQAASEAVMANHPSKLKRGGDDGESEKYAVAIVKWKQQAYYNWAVRNNRDPLTDEQKSQAHTNHPGLKAKKVPPWAIGITKKKAEAGLAAKATKFIDSLSEDVKQIALIEQDDRVLPDPKPEGWQTMPLSAFARDSAWRSRARKYFKKSIGHPSDEKKMTLKQADGRYRALNWAPEESHPMSQFRFFTYLLIPLSVGMFPHLFQHWLTAKSANSFKLSVVAHPLFIMIVWVPCVLLGVWATSGTMPDKPNVALIPPHFPPNAVLAYMVKQLTGPLLGGLLTAGILAAIMSSLDSQFLCIGSIFTNDVVVHYGGENRFTDKQKVLFARLFVVGIVALTYGLSLFEPRRVFTMGVWCFSGFASMFPLVVAAVYWRKLTAPGAMAAVLVAIATWLYLFYDSGLGMNASYSVDISIGGETYETMPVATIFLASLVAMVVVSLLTKPPSKKTLDKFFD